MQSTKGKVLLVLVFALFLVLGFVFLLRMQTGSKPKGPENTPVAKIDIESLSRPGVQFDAYPKDFPKDLMFTPGQFEQSSRYKASNGQEVISIIYPFGELKASVAMFKTLLAQAKWKVQEKGGASGETLLDATKENMRAEITVRMVEPDTSKVRILYYLPK